MVPAIVLPRLVASVFFMPFFSEPPRSYPLEPAGCGLIAILAIRLLLPIDII